MGSIPETTPLRKTDSLSLRSHDLPILSARDGPWHPSHIMESWLAWYYYVSLTCNHNCCMSSWVQLPCHVQKTLLSSSSHWPLPLRIFLHFLLQHSLSLWEGSAGEPVGAILQKKTLNTFQWYEVHPMGSTTEAQALWADSWWALHPWFPHVPNSRTLVRQIWGNLVWKTNKARAGVFAWGRPAQGYPWYLLTLVKTSTSSLLPAITPLPSPPCCY